MSVICVDFDGTVVEQGDYASPWLHLRPGAREGLWRLRAADHVLVLYSARANRSLLYDGSWDPMVRVGHVGRDALGLGSVEARDLHWRRWRQMVEFCDRELPGVFHAIDDGMQGKPVCDIFIDDKAWGASVNWAEISAALGASWLPDLQPVEMVEDMHYSDVLASMRVLGPEHVAPIGWTAVGPILRKRLIPRTGKPRGRVAVIAGQHGEEHAGVVAVCNHWRALQQLADAWQVEAWVYPCINPEGFDVGKRWNWRGQRPTNAAIEYEIGPGQWVGEVTPAEPTEQPRATRRCVRASDESLWLVNDLERCRPDVVLDLHQDSMVEAGGAFAYTFGRRAPYQDAMRRSGAIPLADALLRNEEWTTAARDLRTDPNGLTTFHDGSITAWCWLRGARLAACVETGFKDFPRAVAIHWEWIRWALEAGGTGVRARAESGSMLPSAWDGTPLETAPKSADDHPPLEAVRRA